MCWRLALVNAGLLASGFEVMHTRVKWIQSPNRKFVLSPINNSPLASALPLKLTIADLHESMYLSRMQYFSAKADQTIMWDATGSCIEAAGNTNGAEVRINRCTSGPTQQWDFLLQTKQIRLKGTSSCLHVNDEAGLNGAPIELRACDDLASWEFLDSDPLLEHTSLSYTRHVVMVFLSITALLSLGAWWWKQLAKSDHSIANMPSDMHQGGVSLRVPLAGHQGTRPPIPSLDLTKQNMVPAAMTMNPSQVKQKLSSATPTLEKVPAFQDPKTFGLIPINIEVPLYVEVEDDHDGSCATADLYVDLVQNELRYGVEQARALKKAVDSFEDDIKNVLRRDINWGAFAEDFRVIGTTGDVAMDLQTSQWHSLMLRAMCTSFDVKEKVEVKFFLSPGKGSDLRDTFVRTRSKIQVVNKEGSPFPYFWQAADPTEITLEASFHLTGANLIDYMQIAELCVNGVPLKSFPRLSKGNDFAVNVKAMEEWMNGIKLHDLRPWWTPFASYLTNIRTIGEGNYARVFLMDEIRPPSTVPTTIAMKEIILDKSPESMVHNEIGAMRSLGDFVRSDASIRRQKIGTSQDFSPYCEPLLAEPKKHDRRIYLPLPFYNNGPFVHIFEDPDTRQAFGGDRGMYAFMLHVARGVKALHGAGWAHHDLHGYNVMVSCGSGKSLAECHASVIDYGLATRLDEPGKGPRGMIHCQAPEMMTSLSGDKRKMDVWSLGMLLWEIRFGWQALPLEHLSLHEAKEKLLTLDFKDADHPALKEEPEIANLLSGMLTANPSERWDLDRVIEEFGKIAHPEMLGPHESPLVNAGALAYKVAPASCDPHMACGVQVELVGMPKAARLNGQVGTIMHHDKFGKVYWVQMERASPYCIIAGESNVRLFH